MRTLATGTVKNNITTVIDWRFKEKSTTGLDFYNRLQSWLRANEGKWSTDKYWFLRSPTVAVGRWHSIAGRRWTHYTGRIL